MKYHVLTIGISEKLCNCLNVEFNESNVTLIRALNIPDGVQLFSRQDFSLVVTDLRAMEPSSGMNFLIGLRRTRFVPIFALADYEDEKLVEQMLDYGVDVCQPRDLSPRLLAKQAKALFRRYTAYNHYDAPAAPEAAPFQCGDIYIDPLRHTVQVLDRPVELRPREFSLLLCFMRHPHAILSADQICEYAWNMEYTQSVGQSVYDLRQKIEPDPSKPIYIETAYRVGYRFTAHSSETCGRKESIRKVIGKL